MVSIGGHHRNVEGCNDPGDIFPIPRHNNMILKPQLANVSLDGLPHGAFTHDEQTDIRKSRANVRHGVQEHLMRFPAPQNGHNPQNRRIDRYPIGASQRTTVHVGEILQCHAGRNGVHPIGIEPQIVDELIPDELPRRHHFLAEAAIEETVQQAIVHLRGDMPSANQSHSLETGSQRGSPAVG